jgi:hypothetical protein
MPCLHFDGHVPLGCFKCRNGDFSRHGTQISINPKACTQWRQFLKLCQQSVGLLGNCQEVYTHSGRRVRALDEITHGRVYVVSGGEPFRKLSYPSKGADWAKVPQEIKKAGADANEAGYEERMERLHAASQAIRITLYTTDPTTPGVCMTLSERDLKSFE